MILRALIFLYFSLNWLMLHKSWEKEVPKTVLWSWMLLAVSALLMEG